VTKLSGVLSEAFVTFDLDNDSTKGNETDYDMSLRGAVVRVFRTASSFTSTLPEG
jgi:hypothetical protein